MAWKLHNGGTRQYRLQLERILILSIFDRKMFIELWKGGPLIRTVADEFLRLVLRL